MYLLFSFFPSLLSSITSTDDAHVGILDSKIDKFQTILSDQCNFLSKDRVELKNRTAETAEATEACSHETRKREERPFRQLKVVRSIRNREGNSHNPNKQKSNLDST